MVERIKRNWRDLKRSEPGQRFQDRYARRQRASDGRWDRYSVINSSLGILLTAVGLALIPAPGPGWVVTLIGMGLLGGEFAPIARALDWLELKGRAAATWGQEVWNDAPTPVKTLIVLCILVFASALGYGAYELATNG